jgi:hypothetical protein
MAKEQSGEVSRWKLTKKEGQLFFLFFVVLGLNSESLPWATPPVFFLWRVFQDRVSQIVW